MHSETRTTRRQEESKTDGRRGSSGGPSPPPGHHTPPILVCFVGVRQGGGSWGVSTTVGSTAGEAANVLIDKLADTRAAGVVGRRASRKLRYRATSTPRAARLVAQQRLDLSRLLARRATPGGLAPLAVACRQSTRVTPPRAGRVPARSRRPARPDEVEGMGAGPQGPKQFLRHHVAPELCERFSTISVELVPMAEWVRRCPPW